MFSCSQQRQLGFEAPTGVRPPRWRARPRADTASTKDWTFCRQWMCATDVDIMIYALLYIYVHSIQDAYDYMVYTYFHIISSKAIACFPNYHMKNEWLQTSCKSNFEVWINPWETKRRFRPAIRTDRDLLIQTLNFQDSMMMNVWHR